MQYAVREPMPGVVYPPAERTKAYVDAGELPEIGLAQALTESFSRHADRVAVHSLEGDLSYRELDTAAVRFAAALLDLGLAPLDRVLFQVANCKELMVAFVGCLKAGLIPVCTLPAHREAEIGYIGRHVDARAHVVQGDDARFDLVAFALRMKRAIPTMRHVISLRGAPSDGAMRLEDLVERQDAAQARQAVRSVPNDAFQVCVFQLSGGTTGVPKVIPRMGNDYYLNAKLTAELYGFGPGDVMFMPMPMIHNACMVCFWLPALLSGAAFAIPPDMTPDGWGEAFRTFRPTWIGMMRAAIPRLEEMIARKLATFERVRGAWSPDGGRILEEKLGLFAFSMFGMTEGTNLCVRPDDPLDLRVSAVGRPLSRFDEVVLVQPGTEIPVPPGTPGEFTCRGPYTLSGYYNAPDRNVQAFNQNGFYNSGDLMVETILGGRSNYAFAGRTKDVVVRGMEKINAEEVENALVSHVDISDCAIVAMPDPVLGERSCAFVVPRTGKAAPTVRDLALHLEGKGLAKFKWPERVEEIAAMPLTRVGKLDKAALRKAVAERLAAEAAEPESGQTAS